MAQDLGLPQPGRKFGHGMQRQPSPRMEPELGRGNSRCWHVCKQCIRSSPQLWWWLFYQRPHQDMHWGSMWALPGLHWDPTTVIPDNLEMDKFLETYKMSRLTQEETDNLNREITSSEIEFVINKQTNKKPLSKQKSSSTRLFHWWILPNIQRRANTYPSQIIFKNGKDRTFPNSFYEVTITLIPKPGKKNISSQYLW